MKRQRLLVFAVPHPCCFSCWQLAICSLRKLVGLMPSDENKARTIDIAHSIKKASISPPIQSLTGYDKRASVPAFQTKLIPR